MASELSESNPLVREAAYVAATFHIDPLVCLDGDILDFVIRVAAANYINTEKAKAQGTVTDNIEYD